eukprot:TRINITY_DN17049_c0_g1_i1.p1 TRINITY_DN17049_c0_g1~~TRINITY_DN17049_c0_g1_i1.p1  ORF type:complete len:215 (+),score=35.11 TRINITY_DN17049_c0_g1_i1:278-922(+)
MTQHQRQRLCFALSCYRACPGLPLDLLPVVLEYLPTRISDAWALARTNHDTRGQGVRLRARLSPVSLWLSESSHNGWFHVAVDGVVGPHVVYDYCGPKRQSPACDPCKDTPLKWPAAAEVKFGSWTLQRVPCGGGVELLDVRHTSSPSERLRLDTNGELVFEQSLPERVEDHGELFLGVLHVGPSGYRSQKVPLPLDWRVLPRNQRTDHWVVMS